MQIKQWEDKSLAQFSYAVLSESEKKIILIDPSRDPQPFLDYAKENGAAIVGIIETHPHADFVSSHLELRQLTGATIYVNSEVGVFYPHVDFDEGDSITMGKIQLLPLNTPGHSPDSITILLEEDGKQKAIFTGDTLFIGDCGRPDLREGAGNVKVARKELATNMYHSLRNKIMKLEDHVIVYPGHGAGSLCGKGLSEADTSTLGKEKQTNWSLQPMTEEEFVTTLLSGQPFIPAYFPFDVEVNRRGAAPFRQSVDQVQIGNAIKNEEDASRLDKNLWVVDGRDEGEFQKGHLPKSVNLMQGDKFETWLGSIIQPGEPFYLAGENERQLKALLERAAFIGYEGQVKEAFILESGSEQGNKIEAGSLQRNPEKYTIVDVRNGEEVKNFKPFAHSLSIPLSELRNRVGEVPTDKPVVVHCAGGYRSAAGSSILEAALKHKVKVYDLGEGIKEFIK